MKDVTLRYGAWVHPKNSQSNPSTCFLERGVKAPYHSSHLEMPKKIYLFMWLVWDNKILILEDMTLWGCNTLPTSTCVMCYAAIKSVDRIFFSFLVVAQLWEFYRSLKGLHSLPRTYNKFCRPWRLNLRSLRKETWELSSLSITWNIWLDRNDWMFKHSTFFYFFDHV